MFKRILVPLDGSDLAEIALPYAEEIAGKMGSEVIIIHAKEPAEDQGKPEHRPYLSKIAAQTEQNIKKSHTIAPGEKVKVTSAVIGGTGVLTRPAEQIVEYTEKENISLIIMATHGRTGISRWALGDTANKVARSVKCPILLIRAATKKPGNIRLDKILVTLDGSKQGEAVLPYVVAMASRFKNNITLINVVEQIYHVYPVYESATYYGGAGMVKVPYGEEEMKPFKKTAEEYIEKVNEKLSGEGFNASYLVKTGSASEEIIKAADETHADLVVMSTHGHSGFGRWDHGSITDKVLHGGNTPLLLVRPSREE
jgi:nucleotide-binding universal stress UspA family protein